MSYLKSCLGSGCARGCAGGLCRPVGGCAGGCAGERCFETWISIQARIHCENNGWQFRATENIQLAKTHTRVVWLCSNSALAMSFVKSCLEQYKKLKWGSLVRIYRISKHNDGLSMDGRWIHMNIYTIWIAWMCMKREYAWISYIFAHIH